MRALRACGPLLGAALFFSALALIEAPAQADDFYCEVMAVEGHATITNAELVAGPLAEGDLLKADDLIEVSSDSYVDLAYDREWSNVTRIEENSKVRLRSIEPVEIELEEGGVFAKLKALPKDSSFDVKTPTAIASVRGTEYRTTFLSGETQIYNVSDSDVYVFGIDEAGAKQAEPVVLRRSQATQVPKRGVRPVQPRPMQEREFQPVRQSQQAIDKKIQQNKSDGRFGKMKDLKEAGARREEMRRRSGENRSDPSRSERPRTMDGREAGEAAARLRGEEPKADGGDLERAGGLDERQPASMRSDESGKKPSGGKPKTLSGDEAREATRSLRGSDSRDELAERRSDSSFSGGGSDALRSDEGGDRTARASGLGEPYFPGNEKKRGGGPKPGNLPEDRWKSGAEQPQNHSLREGDRRPEGSSSQASEARQAPDDRNQSRVYSAQISRKVSQQQKTQSRAKPPAKSQKRP